MATAKLRRFPRETGVSFLALASLASTIAILLILAPNRALADQPNPWQPVSPIGYQNNLVASDKWVQPDVFKAFNLDQATLQSTLRSASQGGSQQLIASQPSSILLPLPDGTYSTFQFVESSVMAPELAAKFPEIKTYVGQSVDKPGATVRFDSTPFGIHAQILSPDGAVYIDPWQKGNTNLHVCYFKKDYHSEANGFQCNTSADGSGTIKKKGAGTTQTASMMSGGVLRTYRLACAATAEYCQYFGGTVSSGMAAIATAVNRVTGIYESELSIRLVLVANNNLIVYTNTTTDPYTDNNPSMLLSQNQSNLDCVIGSANYDIGHVFGTGGGGLAGVGVVCVSGLKAQGETGIYPPTGDAFWVDYVAHEMGHQFGACHTFNSTNSGCNWNRNGSTAYEPGSGSTIMAYAGVCGTDNLQFHSDPYFHSASIDQITACFSTGGASMGGTATANGNLPPVIAPTANYIVPRGTPFALTAAGSDPNGDSITWCWEERDLGPSVSVTYGDNGMSPIFRSFAPSASPSRTFPQISDILNNSTTAGERLPSLVRTMSFRVTARDNRPGGGGMATADLQVVVNTNCGPFKVTAASTNVTWSGAQTITWNVAGTTNAPINVTNVCVLLSTNGGLSFPFVLATNVPNNGSQTVTLPNLTTTAARIKVQAIGNIFFDISHTNFTIIPTVADVAVSQTPSSSTVATGGQLTYSLRVTNLGPTTATSLIVTDSLPATLTGVAATTSQGSYSFVSGKFIWVIGNLNNGSVVTVSITGTTTNPGLLTNSIATSATTTDPVSNNNSNVSIVVVPPVHDGPALPFQFARVLTNMNTLLVTNTAVDYDVPVLALTYQLVNPPTGATIDTNGIISWTPAPGLMAGNYTFKTIVSDCGSPQLKATNYFTVSLQNALLPEPDLVASVQISNGIPIISWPAVTNQSYRVQYVDCITSQDWNDLSPDITADSSKAWIADLTDLPAHRFYRIMKLQ